MESKQIIRALRGSFKVEDFEALAALLVKCGYTVRITRATKVGTKSKENVIEYYIENAEEA